MEGNYKFLLFFAAVTCTAATVNITDVTYAVRTPRNPDNLNFTEPVDLAAINSSYPVVFVVHGWTDNGSDPWTQNLTDSYLLHGGFNVIIVDWRRIAAQNYLAAVADLRAVGNIIGDTIVSINRTKRISLKRFHLIGHSLGAHIVGFAGQRVYDVTRIKVNWVTGLDPAGPLFEVPPVARRNRLNSGDATVVEIIHTDGGIDGFVSAIGTIDFYPNGGLYIQPTCNETNVNLLTEIYDLVACSHGKSVLYYVIAVRELGITATKCGSWVQFQLGLCRGNQQAKFGGRYAPRQTGTYYDYVNY